MCSAKGRDLLVMTRAVRRKWELDMAGELTTRAAALQVDLTDINACHSVAGKISIAR
jgi:hypothetical protein